MANERGQLFWRLVQTAKLGKNDQEWSPRWIQRYAHSVEPVNGDLPVRENDVIRFLRSLLENKVPAWQRLQAVRAIEAYRILGAAYRGYREAVSAGVHDRLYTNLWEGSGP